MTQTDTQPTIAIAGSGAIACGLAASLSSLGPLVILARSPDSAARAYEGASRATLKLEGADAARISCLTDPAELAAAAPVLVVEAIAEEMEAKVALLSALGAACPGADFATTTSSLPVGELGERSGLAERFYGLHVFNPVTRMRLVELIFTAETAEATRARARTLCEQLGKLAVEVPDTAGFVVNRLLFPFLFDAVRLLERTGLEPSAVDECMTLGAGHPMGPLAVLDFVGLDIAVAIGDQLHASSGEEAHRPPETLRLMCARGHLGRKSGEGFYSYPG